jgi:hypothetical protein
MHIKEALGELIGQRCDCAIDLEMADHRSMRLR